MNLGGIVNNNLEGLILLSHTLGVDDPGYRGSSGMIIENVSCMHEGDSCNTQKWILSNHFGTHMDAPKHFSISGKALTDLPVEYYSFNQISFIHLKDVCENEMISIEHLEAFIDPACEMILIRTEFEEKRSSEAYWGANPGLTAELGEWLRQEYPDVRMIGFDFISLTSFAHRKQGREAHKAFLDPARPGQPISIIEDMKLAALAESPQWVLVSPLLVRDADGGPVTVWCQPA